jgi:sugar phosphate isomerase/epimerase
MRLGASTWVWSFPFDPGRDHALVDRVVSLGGDHVELGGEAVGMDVAAFRDAVARAGVTASICGIFGPERDLSGDDATRAAGLGYVEACLETATEIGASTVIGAMIGTGGVELVEGRERRVRLDRARETLADAAAGARGAGVRLGLECLNRYENNLVTTVAEAVELVDAVGDDALGEERRLLHVALSRAAEEVHCSWARARSSGTRVARREPSPWLAALEEAARAFVRPRADPARYVTEMREVLAASSPPAAKQRTRRGRVR